MYADSMYAMQCYLLHNMRTKKFSFQRMGQNGREANEDERLQIIVDFLWKRHFAQLICRFSARQILFYS